MNRTGAAERDQHRAGRIAAALAHMNAHRGRHRLVDDVVDGPGRGGRGKAERLGDLRCDCLIGGGAVEPHGAAGKAIRIEITEHQIGIRDGRLGTA